jgi:large subunit ribosomal protein L23
MARTKKADVKDTKKLSKATVHDLDVIIEPVLTEKSMQLMQEQNKVTLKVRPTANKVEVKIAFERIFGVKVEDVNISNVRSTKTTRGGRYQGTIPGYKKAIVTVAEGEALDLFKE